MKNLLITLIFVALAVPAIAQMPPAGKPDMELTKKEAELRIQDMQSKVVDLESKLEALKTEQGDVQSRIDQAKKDLEDCKEAILKLIGANAADVEAFKQQLGVLEGKVREMKRLSNDELADRRAEVEDLDRQYMELRKNK